jgi:hypothetical protein
MYKCDMVNGNGKMRDDTTNKNEDLWRQVQIQKMALRSALDTW